MSVEYLVIFDPDGKRLMKTLSATDDFDAVKKAEKLYGPDGWLLKRYVRDGHSSYIVDDRSEGAKEMKP